MTLEDLEKASKTLKKVTEKIWKVIRMSLKGFRKSPKEF